MAVNHPRTKLVNFRLSSEEYEGLKDACGNNNARSVSDFARSAVLSKFRPADQPVFETNLTAVNNKVGELESNLQNLMRQMGLLPKPMALVAIHSGVAFNSSPQARNE